MSMTFKKVINKATLVLMALLVVVSTVNIGSALADSTTYSKSSLNTSGIFRNSIITGTKNTSAVSSYDSSFTQLGIDAIFGTSYRYTLYTGEVPANADDWDEYPSYSYEEILGLARLWVDNYGDSDRGYFTWDDDGTDDIHAKYLMYDSSWLDFSSGLAEVGGIILYGAAWIASYVVGAFISLATSDITDAVSSAIVENLSETISGAVIGDSTFSPVFILALAVFLFGLVALIFKFITTGAAALSAIIQEALICCLALIIAFGGGSFGTAISSAAVDLTENIMSAITTGTTKSSELFTYKTDDASEELAANLKAQLSKLSIDSMIKGQFGFSVDELYLWGGDTLSTSESWGVSEDEMKKYVNLVTGNENTFAITTSIGSSSSVQNPGYGTSNKNSPNIGYYWYCVVSGISPYNSYYESSSGSLAAVTGDQYGTLFVVDLLALLAHDGNAKAETILDSWNSPSLDIAGAFFNILLIVAIFMATVMTTVYCLAYKLLFTCGSIFVPLLPLLLLVRKTRDLAKKAVSTWLYAALLMVVCQVMVVLAIQIPVQIAADGEVLSKFIAIILAFALAHFFPKLVSVVAEAANRAMQPAGFAHRIANESVKKGEKYGERFRGNLYNAFTPQRVKDSVANTKHALSEAKQGMSDILNNRWGEPEIDNADTANGENTEAKVDNKEENKDKDATKEGEQYEQTSLGDIFDENGNKIGNLMDENDEVTVDNEQIALDDMFDENGNVVDMSVKDGEETTVDNKQLTFDDLLNRDAGDSQEGEKSTRTVKIDSSFGGSGNGELSADNTDQLQNNNVKAVSTPAANRSNVRINTSRANTAQDMSQVNLNDVRSKSGVVGNVSTNRATNNSPAKTSADKNLKLKINGKGASKEANNTDAEQMSLDDLME